jgi:hypothetical protein
MSKAITAVTTALNQAQAQGPAGTGPYTQTYTSPSGGTAVLSLQSCTSINTVSTGVTPGYGTWGTIAFSNYLDAASGDTINGTLQVVVYQISGTTPTGTITWTGFVGLVDVTGTLLFSGSTTGSVMCDFLASVNGSAFTLSGTVATGGTYFNASTGAVTTTPLPTVAFSQTSATGYAPSLGTPLSLTSVGTTIYYTTDGSIPNVGQGTTAVYTVPLTSGTVGSVVIAFGVYGSSSSRLSLVVYPGAG